MHYTFCCLILPEDGHPHQDQKSTLRSIFTLMVDSSKSLHRLFFFLAFVCLSVFLRGRGHKTVFQLLQCEFSHSQLSSSPTLLWWPFWTPLADAHFSDLVAHGQNYHCTHVAHSVQANLSVFCLHIAVSSVSIYLLWKDNSSMIERYIIIMF